MRKAVTKHDAYKHYDVMGHDEILSEVVTELLLESEEDLDPRQVVRVLKSRGVEWDAIEQKVEQYLTNASS